MKNKRLCKVWSKRHLPTDLWPEILSRLPVKSLLRFRCVSKSWLSLVDDADFARLHLNNFKNNRDETHLLVVHGKQQNFDVRCSDTFETNSETLYSLGKEDYDNWHIVCSIDGLILLKIRTTSGRFSVLRVWNPSIRKFCGFPSLPEIKTSPNSSLRDEDIGLGYDPSSNDYKHVKLIYARGTLHSVAIYSLGAGSWKITKIQGKGSSCSNWHWKLESFHWRIKGYYNRVYFQGSLYFIAYDARKPYNECVGDLVSFDLSDEMFSAVSMPEDPNFRLYDCEIGLIDGGCSLALFCNSSHSSCDKSVWVLENTRGESESMYWTKRWSFRLKYTQFFYLQKNGNILTRRYRGEYLKAEAGEKKVAWRDEVVSFCPAADECKIVQERRGSQYLIRRVCGYVESLILQK